MKLSDKEIERYSRQIVLDEIGFEGQQKLKNSIVTVVGIGGLGSPITQQLVAMGIGRIRIIDRDVVEISNLHRQVLYGDDDIGLSKAEAAYYRLKRINPQVNIEPLTLSINDDTVDKVVTGSDVVVDGLDSVSARYTINRACVRLKVPYIFGSAIVTTGSATTIIPNKTACLECFQPSLKDEEMPKCGTEGVHPSILTTISSVQVSETIRIITGKEPNLANKLFLADIKKLDYDKITIIKQNRCKVCGSNADLSIKKTKRKLIENNVLDQALNQAKNQINQKFILVHGLNWHSGVLGIIASRLVEKFNKPSIVISTDKTISVGSARSIKQINLGNIVLNAKKEGLLINGGGHRMAAGLKINNNMINKFYDYF